METYIDHAQTGEKVNRLMRQFLGEKTDFTLEEYLKTRKIGTLNDLNRIRRKQLAEDLVGRIIRPATSSGKTSLAMVELMSILKVDVEPWKITASYVPSPREYLLSREMADDFNRLKNYAISKQMVKYNLRDGTRIDDSLKIEIVDAIITDTIGHMPKMTLTYTKELFNRKPIGRVVNDHLAAYMEPAEATKSGQILTQLMSMIFKIDTENEVNDGINEQLLSKRLTEYFNDTNQMLVRKLRNGYDIDPNAMPEEHRSRIIHGIMSHYFGSMSQRFISKEYEKLGFEEQKNDNAEEKGRLANAVIIDCLHSALVKEDVNKAQEELNKLINPTE